MSRHQAAPHPPTDVPDDAIVIIRPFPHRDPIEPTKLVFAYDLWVVDQQAWTGRLPYHAARTVLVAQGYTENAAGRKLQHAREKTKRLIASGGWRGGIPTWRRPAQRAG